MTDKRYVQLNGFLVALAVFSFLLLTITVFTGEDLAAWLFFISFVFMFGMIVIFQPRLNRWVMSKTIQTPSSNDSNNTQKYIEQIDKMINKKKF